VRTIVQADRLPHDLRIAAESAAPQAVAEDVTELSPGASSAGVNHRPMASRRPSIG